jgi:hypothetical protein
MIPKETDKMEKRLLIGCVDSSKDIESKEHSLEAT